MKIATWNVERLGHKGKLPEILSCCEAVQADILVLTETDLQIHTSHANRISTLALPPQSPPYYKPLERQVSICTNYPIIDTYSTCDPHTTLCVEVETPKGPLLVYGTILGIYGNRHATFFPAVEAQMEDLTNLAKLGLSMCVCGDYNCSFSDNYYFTKDGRATITETFQRLGLSILTAEKSACIDHIALSSRWCQDGCQAIEEWNMDKTLSDHKGSKRLISTHHKKAPSSKARELCVTV